MKILNKINSQGIFYIKDLKLPGVLITNNSKHVEIKILLNSRIDFIEAGPVKLPIVNGTLREEGKLITLIDAIACKGFWSSNELFEYVISSNTMIYGVNIKEDSTFTLNNISIVSSILNKLIGNNLLKAHLNINEDIWDLKIKKKIKIDLGENNDLCIKLDSFYNFDKYSMKSKIVIEQINSLNIIFKNDVSIYEAIDLIKKIENFLTFLLQTDIGIDEVVSHFTENVNGKDISIFYHLYYKDEYKSNEIDYTNTLIEPYQFVEKFGGLLLNWIRLDKDIPYLNYFIRLYYTNKFVDQKIISQINLIESIHRFFKGTAQDSQVIIERNKRICDQITSSEEDRTLVENKLRNMNGYGISRKIREIAEIANMPFEKKYIEKINSIRQNFAHGDAQKEISLKEYKQINEDLNIRINAIIMKELNKA